MMDLSISILCNLISKVTQATLQHWSALALEALQRNNGIQWTVTQPDERLSGSSDIAVWVHELPKLNVYHRHA